MRTALDVEPNKFIKALAEKLKGLVEEPEYIKFVKSGAHVERPPEQENFWYIRCASILRQAYKMPRIGTNRLRTHYGGRKNRGRRPEHHVRAGGKIIRNALQALEKAGLLVKLDKGRALSPKGRKLLDEVAKSL